MDFWSIIGTILAAAGIPSAIFGVFIRQLNKKLDRQEKRREEREQARLKNQIIQMELIAASLSLGEATAEAVQRIPDSLEPITSAVRPTAMQVIRRGSTALHSTWVSTPRGRKSSVSS